ncbi:MraY family glycosyltransferase [soil metagenome]
MILVAAGMLIAYVVTFFLMPFVIKIARINKLYDKPDERKTHINSISSLGGTGMIAGLTISLLLVSDFNNAADSVFQYYLASIFIIFMLGVIDDIFVLHPLKKVFGQLLVALILTTKAHLLITDLQGLGGFYHLDATASYIITFFCILLIINSFNLIDGVDGLAGSLGLVSSLAFGVFFYMNMNIPYAILAFSMTGTLLAFLIYNFPPARIFMGDSGSMMIGVVNAILFIKFIADGNPSAALPLSSPLALGFGFLLLPLMDVLRVFIIRLTKGTSPFAPDRNHIHHLLLNKGFSHTQVTVILFSASTLLTFVAYFLNYLNINIIVGILCLLFFTGIFILKYFTRFNPLYVVPGKDDFLHGNDAKVLSMYNAKEAEIQQKNKESSSTPPSGNNIGQKKAE